MSTLSPRPEAIVDALPLRPRQANPRLAAILAPENGPGREADPPKPLGSALTSTNTEP